MRPNPTPPFTAEEISHFINTGQWNRDLAMQHAAAGGIKPKEPDTPSSAEIAISEIGGPIAALGGMWAANELFSQGAAQAGTQAASSAASGAASGASGAAPAAPSVVGGAWGGPAPAVPQVVNAGAQPVGAQAGLLGPWAVPLGAAGVAAYYGPSAVSAAQDLFSDDTAAQTSGGVRAAALSNPITAWAVPITDALGIDLSFGAGKHEDQLRRDAARDHFADIGAALVGEDGHHQVQLTDGSTFDIGRDGGEPFYNVGYGTQGYVDGTEQAPGDVTQYIDANYGQTVGALDPLIAYHTGGNDKLRRDMTGYYTNAFHSVSDPEKEIASFYEQHSPGRDELYGWVVQQYNDGKLDADTANAWRAEIDKRYGVVNPNQGRGGKDEGFF